MRGSPHPALGVVGGSWDTVSPLVPRLHTKERLPIEQHGREAD